MTDEVIVVLILLHEYTIWYYKVWEINTVIEKPMSYTT